MTDFTNIVMMLKRLAGQTLIYGLSTIVPRLINYALTPYFTYFALTKTDFGVMSYFYASIPLIFSVLLMGMESAFFRFVGKDSEPSVKKKVFNTIWSTTLLFSAIFLVIVLLFQRQIYNYIGEDFSLSIIWFVALIIVADVASAIPFAALREQGKAYRFTIFKTLSVLINVGFVLFFYSLLPALKDNIFFSWMWVENFGCGYVFVANLIASIATLIMLLPAIKGFRFEIDRKLIKRVLFFSFPLFLGGFAGTSNEFIDRHMLKEMLPEAIAYDEIAIYSAVLKITAIMLIFTQMYRYAAEPFFLAKMKKEDFRKANADSFTLFCIVSIAIFLGVTLFIDIFKYFVEAEYRVGLRIVPQLLISGALMGAFLNLNFWYKFVEKTYFAIIISGSGLIVTVALNMWLIPKLGYEGSSWAKVVSSLFMVVLSYVLNQIYYPVPYKIRRIGEYVLLAAAIYFASQYINISNTLLNYSVRTILLLIFLFYAIKREKILLLLRN